MSDNALSLTDRSEEAEARLLIRAKDAIDLVSSYVEKKYYRELSGLAIKPIEDISTEDTAETVWLYKVDKLAYDNKEGDFAEKLGTVASAVSMCGGSLIMLIEVNSGHVTFNIGVADRQGETSLFTVKDTLKHSLTGNFPGSSLTDVLTILLSVCFTSSFNSPTEVESGSFVSTAILI